jgi:hypothetical protein
MDDIEYDNIDLSKAIQDANAHWERSCANKVGHVNQDIAVGEAARLSHLTGNRYSHYHCQHCKWWHTGHDRIALALFGPIATPGCPPYERIMKYALRINSAKFVSYMTLTSEYEFRIGSIPFLMRSRPNSEPIKPSVKIFSVSYDTLKIIDRLHGHPGNAKRVVVNIDESSVQCAENVVQSYIMQNERYREYRRGDTWTPR